MSLRDGIGPLHRDLALGLIALGLLAAPLWIGLLPVGNSIYEYDRAQVTTTDDGIEYVDRPDVPPETPISDAIECPRWNGDVRACAFEVYLLEEADSVPTGIHGSSTSITSVFESHYRYVQIDGAVYETSYVTNESASPNNESGPIEAVLEPADPDAVLSRESIAVDDDRLAPVVAETVRNGPTTARADVDLPQSPIALEDGTYYRVHRVRGPIQLRLVERVLVFALTYVAPVGGLLVLARLSRRVEISYVGDDADDGGSAETDEHRSRSTPRE